MYEDIMRRLYDDIRHNNDNAQDDTSKERDVAMRCAFTAGCANAWARMLNYMGHTAELGTWMDNDRLRVGYLTIDGVNYVKNSRIDHKAFRQAYSEESCRSI